MILFRSKGHPWEHSNRWIMPHPSLPALAEYLLFGSLSL